MTNAATGLHWFRHDLRVTDNEALIALTERVSSVTGVFVIDPKWDEINQYGFTHMGLHRRGFIEHALEDLRIRFRQLGAELLVLYGDPLESICKLVQQNNISHISYEAHHGFNETKQIDQLEDWIAQHASNIELLGGSSNYLYSIEDLPFALENMPDTFSPFRRKVEKYAQVQLPNVTPIAFSSHPINVDGNHVYELSGVSEIPDDGYNGGESAAQKRIETYFFESDRIAQYKETRNGLDGWDFSSRLSVFLAHGCVSPRYVVQKIKEYESQRVANDSTYWLFFELLWREFFHLQHKKHGAQFFARDGIQRKAPPQSQHRRSHNSSADAFEQWCSGDTGYDIVDACMRQLNQTGFMSNRGRQLVASCFVHELGLDWRYGAAYFEQQLIDFDVASNWGNWQYLAGVGSDPRGHRQFNLNKQTEIYDPKRRFVDSWLAP